MMVDVTPSAPMTTDDEANLLANGITAVYTPKDFELAAIMDDIADLAIARR